MHEVSLQVETEHKLQRERERECASDWFIQRLVAVVSLSL